MVSNFQRLHLPSVHLATKYTTVWYNHIAYITPIQLNVGHDRHPSNDAIHHGHHPCQPPTPSSSLPPGGHPCQQLARKSQFRLLVETITTQEAQKTILWMWINELRTMEPLASPETKRRYMPRTEAAKQQRREVNQGPVFCSYCVREPFQYRSGYRRHLHSSGWCLCLT